MFRDFRQFLGKAIVYSFRGGAVFYLWMVVLTAVVGLGVYAYARQLNEGLVTTGMTNQVAWGVYIANFTFIVGVAAAAVMLVIPAYIYRIEDMRDVVVLGELMSFSAIIMALLFVVADLGRPYMFWHMVPGIGVLNFPDSLLAWDVVVLLGYLVLNFYICAYLLYTKYEGLTPTWIFYIPFVFVSIAWAVSIHTVTAFLYVGLVGRPFWNTSIIAPRFLVSAFVSGPALMVLAFQVIRVRTPFFITDRALGVMRQIITVSLLINLFLLASELFKEFYSADMHSASTRYLFLGLAHDGQRYARLVPWIWTAVGAQGLAAAILFSPLRMHLRWFNLACLVSIIGVWIEKGMGLVVPGFVPTPLGDVVEYSPSWNETFICFGIWAFGALLYTWFLKVAVPILTGEFHNEFDREEKSVTPARVDKLSGLPASGRRE